MNRNWDIKFATPEGVMRACASIAVFCGVFAIISETHPPIAAAWSDVLDAIIWCAAAYFAVDLLLRIVFAYVRISQQPEEALWSTLDYLTQAETLSDIVAALAVPIPAVWGLAAEIGRAHV